MRALVTGTSGFVGGAIGSHLRCRGWHVTGLSRGAPRPGAADAAIRHDLRHPVPPGALPEAPDVVIHAAALSAPWGDPAAFRRINVDGTRHAVDFARRAGAHLLLISSSSVLYAPGDQHDLPEAPAPETASVNAYAATKREAEDLVRRAGLPAAILRPRAVFGVGDTVLFPRIARAARMRLLPRLVRPDGEEAVGDLVSVDNLVRAVARAAERRAAGILHLTDGAPVPVGAFVAGALERAGLPGPGLRVPAVAARRAAGMLERLSARTGWWEPPLTRFGVAVFSETKTFSTERADAVLGPPEVPTELALARFAEWWRQGARLDDPAMGRVGTPP